MRKSYHGATARSSSPSHGGRVVARVQTGLTNETLSPGFGLTVGPLYGAGGVEVVRAFVP
ncbi:MAG: hypothetical protein EPO40_37865 [Myxococcaceae bacterium]|nr:MAG: hypothetical protein EPO40_37865 [Myxococcaceae bacterium]